MDARLRLVALAQRNAVGGGAEATPPILRSRSGPPQHLPGDRGAGGALYPYGYARSPSAAAASAAATASASKRADSAAAAAAAVSSSQQHLFAQDLYAKETINVARSESGANLMNLGEVHVDAGGGGCVGAGGSGGGGASGASDGGATGGGAAARFGAHYHFVIVTNPEPPAETTAAAAWSAPPPTSVAATAAATTAAATAAAAASSEADPGVRAVAAPSAHASHVAAPTRGLPTLWPAVSPTALPPASSYSSASSSLLSSLGTFSSMTPPSFDDDSSGVGGGGGGGAGGAAGPVCVQFFRAAEEFLAACRALLARATSPSVLFWVDVDLSVMTAPQQQAFFHMFRLNQITRQDCASEDRFVSDTRLALYRRYLFCIVDTVDDVSSVLDAEPGVADDDGSGGGGAAATAAAAHQLQPPQQQQQRHRAARERLARDRERARARDFAAGALITKNLNIILFNHGVVSVHLQGIDVADDIIGRIHTGRGVIPSCGWLLWCLLDVMTDQMAPLLDASVASADLIDSESVKLSSLDALPSLTGEAAAPSPRRRCGRCSAAPAGGGRRKAARYPCAACWGRSDGGGGRGSAGDESEEEDFGGADDGGADDGGADAGCGRPGRERTHAGSFLLKMGRARRDLERLKASYMSKLELVEKLQADGVRHRFSGDIKFHLSSLLSQIKWKLQRTEMVQVNLKNAYQNYVTCVSLASAAAAGRANETTKSLTLLLAITTPLNLVASIMGMNVYPLNVIFEGDDVEAETPWVFVAVLLSFAAVTAVLFVVAKVACGLKLC